MVSIEAGKLEEVMKCGSGVNVKAVKLHSIAVSKSVFESITDFCDAVGIDEAFVSSKTFVGHIQRMKIKIPVPPSTVSKIQDAFRAKALIKFFATEDRFIEDKEASSCFLSVCNNDDFNAVRKVADAEGHNEIFVRFYKLINYSSIADVHSEGVSRLMGGIKSSYSVGSNDYLRLKM